MKKTIISQKHRLLERGDTIIEVMIAIMVISSVLVSSFILTNKTTRGVRDSEEHSQAAQLLQGQLERLRGVAPSTNYAALPAYFCFEDDGTTLKPLTGPTDYACNASTYYSFVVTKGASPSLPGDTTKFVLKAQWDGVTGNKAGETFVYKVTLAP